MVLLQLAAKGLLKTFKFLPLRVADQLNSALLND
jgi:hypothetical protein